MCKFSRSFILSVFLWWLVAGAGLTGAFLEMRAWRHPAVQAVSVRIFSPAELKAFDGSDPRKPIYLAFEGNVYDVTRGRTYYQPGGRYHELAGTDATRLLHIAGGAIIRKKYPVIGVYREK